MSDPNSPPPARPPGIALGEAIVDLAALGGIVSITWGAALIYHPAGFIVGGLFALGGAWLAASRGAA